MSDTVVAERRCGIEEVFDASFIELLKMAPVNSHVRALILKFTGLMPQPEIETFEQLKDWVEFNCVKRIKQQPCESPIVVQGGGIAINVEFSETEYGRANYSVPRSGNDRFRIYTEELLAIIREAVADDMGIGGVVEAIAAKIEADAWEECAPGLEETADYDYSDHDCSDTENRQVDYSHDEIRGAFHYLPFC